MKKLAVFFIVLISLMIIAGCNQSQKTVTRFTPDGETETTDNDTGAKTTITKLDDDKKTDPAPISISSASKEKVEMPFGVTYPASDSTESTKGYHLIQGTAPSNTDKILVNGQPLTKYKSGASRWNYIAAASLGTLVKGTNNYIITAIDKTGAELGSKTITIEYKGIENAVLANTGSNYSIFIALTIALIGFVGISKVRLSFFATRK